VIASRRISPGPDAYVITSALKIKPKLAISTENQFDSKADRFKFSYLEAQ
jgi:hypothetical protein